MIKTNVRAQVNQAFIYIFVLVIIASIVLVSFILFNRAQESACQAEIIAFQNNLQKYGNEFTDFGNLHRKTLSAPCGVTKLCILNPEVDDAEANAPFVIQQLLDADELENNIVIKQDNAYKPLANIPELKTEAPWNCIQADGRRFSLDFEGKGKYVLVSRTTEE